MTQPEIKVLPDPAAVAAEAAERVVRAADEAIALAGRFSFVLPPSFCRVIMDALIIGSLDQPSGNKKKQS